MTRANGVHRSLGALVAVLLVVVAVALGHQATYRQQQPPTTTGRLGHRLAGASLTRSRPTGFFRGWFVSPTTGWMTMTRQHRAGLYRTNDGGQTWSWQLTLPYPKLFQRDMSFLDESVGFVVVGNLAGGRVVPVLEATNDGGQHWQTRSLPGHGSMVAGLDFVSESRGWVLVENPMGPSTLYSTTDGGSTWVSLAAGATLNGVQPSDHLEGVRFEDATHGWIAGWRSNGPASVTPQYYSTADGGATWTGSVLPIVAGAAAGPGNVYVDPPQRQPDGSLVGGVMVMSGAQSEVEVLAAPAQPTAWTLLLRGASAQATPAWSVANGRLVTSDGQSMHIGVPSPTPAVEHVTLPTGAASFHFVTATDGFAVAAGADGRTPVLYQTVDGGLTWHARAALDS